MKKSLKWTVWEKKSAKWHRENLEICEINWKLQCRQELVLINQDFLKSWSTCAQHNSNYFLVLVYLFCPRIAVVENLTPNPSSLTLVWYLPDIRSQQRLRAITACWFSGQDFKQFVVAHRCEFLSVQNHTENLVEDIRRGRCLHCGPQNLVRRTWGSKTLRLVYMLVVQRLSPLQGIREIQTLEEDLWKNQSALASYSE